MNLLNSSPERKLKSCVLPICRGKRYDLVHKFPMDSERAEQWLDIINLPELNGISLEQIRKRYFICSKHFRKQDYKNCESRSLNKTAIPRLQITSNENIDQSNSDLVEVGAYEVSQTDNIDFHTIEASTEQVDTIDVNTSSQITSLEGEETPIQIVLYKPTKNTHMIANINAENDKTQLLNVRLPKPMKATTESISMSKKPRCATNSIMKRAIDLKYEPQRKKPNLSTNETITSTESKTVNSPVKQDISSNEKKKILIFQNRSLPAPIKVSSFWLRDHCRCSKCYSDTFQRKFNILDIPLDIEPSQVKIDNGTLINITWSDKHVSTYDMLELNRQLNPDVAPSKVKQYFWKRDDINDCKYARVTFTDYLCNDDIAESVVRSLIAFGCAFITSVPANIQSTEIAIKRLFPIQRTHFGEMWSFTDNKVHNDSAYTNEELLAHNDSTYFNDAAGLQILHCINHTGSGGENILTDGFQALRNLKEKHPDSYEYLCKTSIPSEYIEDGYHFKYCAPIIVIDPNTNEPNQIRFNMNDRAVLNNIPTDDVFEFYKHYRLLATEILAKENEWKFKLKPGTVCIFDNWRVLHGRAAYTGKRQMVGCYVSRGEFMSVARRMKFID